MFADMVGYTALMQEDESGARAQRDQHRSLLAAAVARRNGEILQYYGDGTLCIFASAVEAVECAVAVQLVVNKGPLLPLRIGIHTGDIVHDPDGVYGDVVNVSSRIEGLAAPGGVMISSKVFDEIKNHHSLSAVSIGVVRLKKLETHLKIFAISNEGLAVPTENEVRAKAEKGGEGAFWSAGEETVGDGGMPVTIPPVGMGEAFLQRVKDRAVAQWALVYVAAAWVVLKIVEFAVDRLAWSPTIYQGVELLTFAGFFTTLVLAWYHGEKGRQPVRRVEVVILTLLLLATGSAVSFLPDSQSTERASRPGSGPAPQVVDTRPAVAALPWLNRSGDENDEHFTDGIHDEILTRLSKIRGLRVISRQSVMQFRGSSLTAGEIAEALGVRYLLEGGLLRAGDSVRLNVQLVDAHADETAWAASYDRRLSVATLLSIQAEIATTIADTLRAAVTPKEALELRREETENLEAYDFYLQGRGYFLRPGYIQGNFQAAENLFTRAIALDPEFALAQAALSRVHGFIYWERFDPSAARLEAQRVAAEAAVRLQPDLPQAHVAVGWMHYVRGDYREALTEYLEALEGLPNDAEIVANIGYTHRRLGNWPEVYAAFESATSLNPRDANLFYDLGGHSYGSTRRYEEAVSAYGTALTLAPDLYDAEIARGTTFLHWQGQLDTLRAAISRLPEGLHSPEIDLGRAELALWERDGDALLSVIQASPAPIFATQVAFLPKSLYAGWAHDLRGDGQAASEAYDSARAMLEPLVQERPTDGRLLLAMGYALAGLGRDADAAAMALRAVESWRTGRDALSGLQTIEDAARILAQAGRTEEALEQLSAVMEGPSPFSAYTLSMDPLLEPLRGDRRFHALVEAHSPGPAR
jgi:serine/threonine-protein kinase